MIAVSDASPLIAFSSVDKLHLLQQLFDSVIIPFAVRDEVFRSAKSQIPHPNFIVVKPLVSETSARFLNMNLHAGESEAIGIVSPEYFVSPEYLKIIKSHNFMENRYA